MERPIFIVGMGRSGTTLLKSILTAHSRIAIAPETHFMEWAERYGLERGAPDDFDKFWNHYTGTLRFTDLGVEVDRCLELIDIQGSRNFQNAFRAILRAFQERSGSERVGEKTPGHVEYLPQLLEWFPDASVLVMQRDPRAVVASQLKTPWVQNKRTPFSLRQGLVCGSELDFAAKYTQQWVTVYEKLIPAFEQDSRVMVVCYENLVRNVESETRAICRFLGEPFEMRMIEERTEDVVPIPEGTQHISDDQWREWRHEHHARTRSKITTDSVDKWKQSLTKTQIAMIEGGTLRGMNSCGYTAYLPLSHQLAGRTLAKTVLGVSVTENKAREIARSAVHRLRATLGESSRR